MSSKSSPFIPLTLAALTAVGAAFAIHKLATDARTSPAAQTALPVKAQWSATAQGRVEPIGGEIKLSALSAGRIDKLLVAVNDKVLAGDMLLRVDETDALARMQGADAEAAVRKRERDTETNVPRLAQDRRAAEDKLNSTERAIATTRLVFDRLLAQRYANPASVTSDQIARSRKAVEEAVVRLAPDREAYRQSLLAEGAPLPTRLEAGLTAARGELTAAEAALERTRVRAPVDGTVLQVLVRAGELATPSPEQPLVVVGDLSQLRVRAEVEERDASKVQLAQPVVLKTDAYPDREFAGKVTTIAQAMRSPRLAQRGPRRPNDIDVLEVVIDVEAGAPLLPGMRVNVFFRIEGAQSEQPRAELRQSESGITAAARSN